MTRMRLLAASLVALAVLISCKKDRSAPNSQSAASISEGISDNSNSWKTRVSKFGFRIDLPDDVVISNPNPGDYHFTTGEATIHIWMGPVVSANDIDSLSAEDMHRKFGPSSPSSKPNRVKAGVLDALRSTGEARGNKWVSALTAIAPAPPNSNSGPLGADIGYAVWAEVPKKSRASAEMLIDRIISSFAVTEPLTAKQYYEDVVGIHGFSDESSTEQQSPPSEYGNAGQDRESVEINRLIAKGHDLWNRGNRQAAIDSYSSVIRLDPSNPYGHFGMGMQSARQSEKQEVLQDGEPAMTLRSAKASLTFYLESKADRGTGTDAERRKLAKTTLASVLARFNQASEQADGFELHEGLRRFKAGNRWGFVDESGKPIIKPQFDFARNFSEGLAAVKQGDLWGYIDRTGKFIIPPQFLDAKTFTQGVGSVARKGDGPGIYRFVDREGRPAHNPSY